MDVGTGEDALICVDPTDEPHMLAMTSLATSCDMTVVKSVVTVVAPMNAR